eukprot:CAMPEP_0113669260 /NCGR_PEP_ID=MMETSP0038_2-20120614/4472_1 /TAXON_ID=2898 /ORGANISM="Cryptomonas paramecium" /LENGTH=169 /DNA_ID=CAMNT_0000585125 /DNA_START=427 /DNA_END=932 /DNA_ORIENTATION=- /assembly_acc=CAM_ASM_000170
MAVVKGLSNQAKSHKPSTPPPPIYELENVPEESLIEMDSGPGFSLFKIANSCDKLFDVRVSRSQSNLLGMHPEEYLARAGARELPFTMMDCDAFLNMLYRSVQKLVSDSPQGDLFVRMCWGLDHAKRYVLAQVNTRVIGGQVVMTMRPVEPEEYDRATQLRPLCCPLFS